ncbi:unnamed protein product [Pelagomonas calceolata]|uniref:MYND-type domain-containing protein n=1 Tax=Pelagomonas calceolata TaxID=35677 RepID=A0A8J2S6Y9_9STRA|nr:unnamed protein product [Pelagomonas calceolata]
MQQAEVEAARRALAIFQQRSPDIDPEVWTVIHCRLQDDAASAASEPTKICSAGCGLAENARMFSKKQWSARAVRRCVACVKACVEPKLCTHGKGAFDCAACIAIVKREAEAEAEVAAAERRRAEPACVLEAAVHVEPEQHDANKKYTEAVVVAAKTCAEDVKGQTCYICTQAVHWRTKEGLVRACACGDRERYVSGVPTGATGVVHISCLVEQAKILIEDAEERDLGANAFSERWSRWSHCSLCEQAYHGVVRRALSWACWKTYVGRPEADVTRRLAMTLFGNGSGDFDPTDTDDLRPVCANCGRDNASKTCGRCMAQAYCSTECQRADWKRHKSSCQSVELEDREESNASEPPADAAEVEKYPSRSGLEKSDLFQAIHKAVIASADSPSLRLADSPVFLEFTKAVAAHTQYALNADRGNLMQRLAHDILVHTPEQQMLDTIKSAGWVPSEERALFLKQYRFILELRANSEQVTKSKQEMDKVKKIMAQYLARENRETKNSWVKKLVEDAGRAYERHRRQNQRVERRKCDVCERQDLTSAPRFMMCAGCGKRRYCSGICQEKDWRENGHKMTCAPISDFACRVTGGCPVSERGYCDFCAETFCLDCEDDLRRCDDCGLYSCGSQEAHKFGPIDRICPRIWGCEACGKYYCPRCQVVETCVICDMDFCDFCGSNCSICNDPICDKCCDAREAKGLANLCAQCADVSGWELVDGRWVKRPRADDAVHDALADRVGALEAKP